jgi:hypothetical protein
VRRRKRPTETTEDEYEYEDDYGEQQDGPLFRGLGTCLLAAGRQALSARFQAFPSRFAMKRCFFLPSGATLGKLYVSTVPPPTCRYTNMRTAKIITTTC